MADPRAALHGQRQTEVVRVDIGLDRQDRVVRNQLDPHSGRHVVDRVDSADRFGQCQLVGDRGCDDSQLRMILNRSQIDGSTGREVVENGDLMTLDEKTFGQMAADETGAAGDETMRHEKKPMGVIPGAEWTEEE